MDPEPERPRPARTAAAHGPSTPARAEGVGTGLADGTPEAPDAARAEPPAPAGVSDDAPATAVSDEAVSPTDPQAPAPPRLRASVLPLAGPALILVGLVLWSLAPELLAVAPWWPWALALGGMLLVADVALLDAALERGSTATLLSQLDARRRPWCERWLVDAAQPEELLSFAHGAGLLIGAAGLTFGFAGGGSVTPGAMLAGLAVAFAWGSGVVPLMTALRERARPERAIVRGLWLLRPVCHTFGPLRALRLRVAGVLIRLFGLPPTPSGEAKLEADILEVVEQGERAGLLDRDDKELIKQVIDFWDAKVSEVMTPRTDMIGVERSTPIREAVRLAHEHGHARLPVFEGHRDHIVGIFNVRDLLGHIETGIDKLVLDKVMRPPAFVPETKDVSDLLKEMRAQKASIAIVLDEYGGTAGLVTLEDILEEIVGDIQDEFDDEDAARGLMRRGPGIYEVDARFHVDDLNEALGLKLPEEEDFESVGGFVFFAFGKVPERGESVVAHGARFTVLDADERRVTRVRIERIRPESPAAKP